MGIDEDELTGPEVPEEGAGDRAAHVARADDGDGPWNGVDRVLSAGSVQAVP
jgi:hypothetical protein